MPKKTPAGSGPLKEQVELWLKARQQIFRAEQIKAKIQPAIVAALRSSPSKSREFGTATLSLTEFTQTRLDAKAAEEALGKDLLAPFMNESLVTQIRVK